MTEVRLACNAMATRFEFLLLGEEESFLRAAGEEAIREIHRIEDVLSFYRKQSTLSQLNAKAGYEPVSVNAEVFSFLQRVSEWSRKTNGAFDPTVGSLMHAWGFTGKTGFRPGEKQLREILKYTGIQHVLLDEKSRTVRFTGPHVRLDPGAVGKGYALDETALLLQEMGVHHALVHGGTSSVIAWGNDGVSRGWQVAIRYPGNKKYADDTLIRTICLENQAMSVSTIRGKAFEIDGKMVGHVIDPGTGLPVEGALLTACTGKSALSTDACSTAMLVLGKNSASCMDRIPEITGYMLILGDNSIIDHLF